MLLPILEWLSFASPQTGMKLTRGSACVVCSISRNTRVGGPMRNQPPVHEPALVSASVSDNDRNRRRNLFGGDVKARRLVWWIAVEIPADPNVTELERSCYSATHID